MPKGGVFHGIFFQIHDSGILSRLVSSGRGASLSHGDEAEVEFHLSRDEVRILRKEGEFCLCFESEPTPSFGIALRFKEILEYEITNRAKFSTTALFDFSSFSFDSVKFGQFPITFVAGQIGNAGFVPKIRLFEVFRVGFLYEYGYLEIDGVADGQSLNKTTEILKTNLVIISRP